MDITFTDLDRYRKVALTGRLDTAGVDAVEVRFTSMIVPNGRSAIVDLTGVEFLASLGVRMLISTARALSWKGAKLAMFGARPAVLDIIETMGFADIVPLAETEAEAAALLEG